jgi:DNA helicase-2/ATP-dependent DNA helicase PcrA
MAVEVAKLIGGAGTGKTTELMGIMEAAKQKLGGSPFSIGFTSFTRAARAEAVSRASDAWNIPPEVLASDGWFKTVHSIAYRQLGVKKGELIDDKKSSIQWIADALGVNVRTIIDDDSGYLRYSGEKSAAAALNAWEQARSRMEPLEQTIRRAARLGDDVPSYAACRQHIEKYEAAKRLDCRFDFTDLLARFCGVRFTVDGIEETDPECELPPNVKAWVMDEQQDASALVDRCCRRLASGDSVKWVYLAGDPMQSIFGFGGSDSRLFMAWEAGKTRVMKKTWRCPAPVLELGEACLKRMRDGYWDRGIAPADHEGEVVRGGYAETVAKGLAATDQTLVIARCNYIVEMWEAILAKNRLPFARLKAKDNTKFLRAANALWSIEHGNPVSSDDFSAAVDLLPATGNMTKGAKAAWGRDETIRQWEVVFPADLEEAGMKPEFAEKLRKGAWGDLFTGAGRWRAAAEKYGPELATKPAIRVGTIHAAKGMEADTVVLSNTVSRRIHEAQGIDPGQHDEERRIEYVGVTRARRRLIVATDQGADYRMRLPL